MAGRSARSSRRLPSPPEDAGDRPYRIFLSSTSSDLSAHRAAVADIIERWDQAPTRMETFGAMPGTPVRKCRQLAARADALVAIVAYRYGWVPGREEGGDGKKSITLLEVEAALEADRPVFGYLVDPSAPWDGERDENQEPLEALRSALDRQVRDLFTTPDDLAKKVSAALGSWLLFKERHPFHADEEIAVARGEINERVLGPLLGIGTRCNAALIAKALARQPLPEDEVLDELLAGTSLAVAKDRLAEFRSTPDGQLHSLQQELSDTVSERQTLRSEIDSIRQEPEPTRQPDESYDRFRERREAHLAAVAELPGKEPRVDALERAERRLEREIGERKSELAERERQLERDVETAREKDILTTLLGLRDAAVEDLASGKTALRGFILALGTEVTAGYLDGRIEDPEIKTSIRGVVDQVATRLEESLSERHRPVEWGFLLTAELVKRRLAENGATVDRVRRELDGLPLAEIAHQTPRVRELANRGIPDVPSYRNLLDPADLTACRELIQEAMQKLKSDVNDTTARLEAVGPILETIREAQEACATQIRAMKRVAERIGGLTEPDVELAWALVTNLARSTSLTSRIREFADWLIERSERAVQTAPLDLVQRANSSRFRVADAERVVDEHAGSVLLRDVARLEETLTKRRERDQEMKRALDGLERVPAQQSARYKTRMTLASLAMALPILNLLPTFLLTGWLSDRALRAALRSDLPAYRRLRSYCRWLLLIASALLAVACVAIVLLLLAGAGVLLETALPERLVEADRVGLVLVLGSYAICLVQVVRALRRLPRAGARPQPVEGRSSGRSRRG